MLPSSRSSSSTLSVEAYNPSSRLNVVAEFLIRRRILLSAILFALLIGQDVAFGPKPHDLINFRDPVSVVGGMFVVLGLALRTWSAGILRKDAELTTTGPYRLVRNPLYVGSFMMMIGFCALIDDMSNFWIILGAMIVLYVVKVRQEERSLSQKFATEWAEYSRQTPRFFPRLALVNLAGDWTLAQWTRSREYQALLATLAALIAIKLWHIA